MLEAAQITASISLPSRPAFAIASFAAATAISASTEIWSFGRSGVCGRITFGCFNNFSKVNGHTLKLWSRVLESVAHARLLLLSHQGRHRGSTLETLQALGIAKERVEFVDYRPRQAYLARLLRQQPTNHVVAERLMSALTYRSFCLPVAPLRHGKALTFEPRG